MIFQSLSYSDCGFAAVFEKLLTHSCIFVFFSHPPTFEYFENDSFIASEIISRTLSNWCTDYVLNNNFFSKMKALWSGNEMFFCFERTFFFSLT